MAILIFFSDYREAKKSPYPHLTMWLLVLYLNCTCMCTIMFQTQPDFPKHLWLIYGDCLFHSCVQLHTVAIVVCSHSSLDNAPWRVVQCAKLKTVWWPGEWCMTCNWTTGNVCSQCCPQWRWSVQVLHCAATTYLW